MSRAKEALREEGKEMSVAACEAVLVELFRRGRLTHLQLTRALAVSRLETDVVLKRHGVTEDLMTMEEFRKEVESLRRAAKWDRQFAEDVRAGRLDALGEEVLRDLRKGRCSR